MKIIIAVEAMMMVMMMIAVGGVKGQNECASDLFPCAAYLNSTKPSGECCNAIKKVVETQLQCLCRLLNNPQLTPGINMTQALEIPAHCNLPSDTSRCSKSGSAPGPLPSSSSLPPPGGNGNGNGNGSNRASWMGMPAFLLVLALSFYHY